MAENMDDEDMDDFTRENGELIVTIVKCQDLFDCDQKYSGYFGPMSHDDIDPYVEIRPSWVEPNSSKASSKTKDLNGAGRNPNFLEKLNGKATLTFQFVKGNIKDDEDVKLSITVNDANKLTKPAFIGSCEWTIPNKVFRYKMTKDSPPLTFTENLKITTKYKSLKENKRYKKYFKTDAELAKQQLGTITFQVKYKAASGNRSKGSKGGQTSRSKGSPRSGSLSPRKTGRKKKNKEDAKKHAELSPDDILHFIQEELSKNETNLQEWLGQYDKDGDGTMTTQELEVALTAYNDGQETEDGTEPQQWSIGFEKNDPRFKKLLERFDLKDSTHNPNGKKKMVSISNIISTATGKLANGSGTQILLSALREKLGDDLHNAKNAENGEVMKFFKGIVEDDEEDKGKDIFERAIDKPDEMKHFKTKVREFVSGSMNENDQAKKDEIQVEWEKRNHIEWPHDYDDLLIFFDTDGDKKIVLKEFAHVLTKGMVNSVEERNAEAEKNEERKASKPLPLNDDDIPVTMPGFLEIKCVSAEALRDTSCWRDKEMDPYVKIRAPWKTQAKCTKPATNMHTEPRWQESQNNLLSFEVTEQHIAGGQSLSEITIFVHDDKSLAIDPLVGKSTVTIERFLTDKKLAKTGRYRRMRTELVHKDGSSSGTLNLEMRFVPKAGIIEESNVEEEEEEGAKTETKVGAHDGDETKEEEVEPKMLCPGIFAIRVVGGVKEGVKEVTDDSNFKLGIIPLWAGRRGLQEPAYPKKKNKKGSQKKHFSFPGALGEEAYNNTIDNIGFRLEIADKVGFIGFKKYQLAYYGTITKKQIMDVKKYKERLTTKYQTKVDKDGERKKQVEEMTTIEVLLSAGTKSKKSKQDGKKISMKVAIDFQQTSEQPLKEEETILPSEAFADGEPPSTTGILEVELIESRNVADQDWFGSSDPYINLQLLPTNKNLNTTTLKLEKNKTMVYKDAGATVEINETFKFPMFCSSHQDYNHGKGKERAGNLKLKMEMKDKDLISDDALGVFAESLDDYLKAGVKGLKLLKQSHSHFYKSLKNTDDKNKRKTTLWYKINFIPATKLIENAVKKNSKAGKDDADKKVNPTNMLIQCLKERTGKCQILVMDAKKLVNVEGVMGGKQDPYVEIRIIDEEDTNYKKDKTNKDKWDKTSVKDGAGKTAFWHEWLELPWGKTMKNIDINKLSALVAVWDANLVSSTLIGVAKIPLIELFKNPGGKFFDIYKGKEMNNALAEKKVGGQVRLATQFVPDPKPLDIVKAAPIKKGKFSFYAGSVSCSDIVAKKKITTASFKVMITDLSKAKEQDPSIETTGVTTDIKTSGMFDFKRKFARDMQYSIPGKDKTSPKFRIDLVTEDKNKVVASSTLPADVLYSAFCVSKECGNKIVKKWIPLTSSTEKKAKVSILKCRIELAWIYQEDNMEDEEEKKEANDEDALKAFFDDETSVLNPCCKPGTLKVRVHNATNLKGNEHFFSKSDPFPTALLLPDDELKRFDYPHMDGMPNPVWHWKDKTPGQWDFLIEDATIASLDLQVSNFDESKGTYGHDIMAYSTVSIGTKLFNDGFDGLKKGEDLIIPVTAKYPLSRYGKGIMKSALKNSFVTAEIWFEEEGDGNFTNGYIPPKAGAVGRPIDLLDPPNEELLALEGMVFCKPIQALSLTNVDSDGKNDIKVVCELFDRAFFGTGEDQPVEEGETKPADSAGESHEFEKTEIIGLKYTSQYLKDATGYASSPYLRIKIVDIDDKKKKDTLIGRVDIPLYAMLKNDGAVYSRKLTLMDEDCMGNRGKLEVLLQFVKDFTGDKKSYVITEEMIKKNSRNPIPGTIDFHVKSGRELQMTIKKKATKDKPVRYTVKPLKVTADPYMQLRLTRGGYTSDHNQSDEPDGATHTTYEHRDGGASPAWDEPPGVLISHDIELDMLHVRGMYKNSKKKIEVIGSFDIPLGEFGSYCKKTTDSKKIEGWFPLMYEGQRNTSNVRMSLTYEQSEPEDKEADKVILSNNAPKGFISGKGMLDVTIVAARGTKTKKSRGVDYFVRCKVVAADGAINFRKLPGGQFDTQVDEYVASGDQAVFNHRQKIDISWKREDLKLPVMKVELRRKKGGSEGTCEVDLAPFIQAPGQPAEFWMEIKEGIDVKIAIRFDDHKRELDRTDTKYFKQAIKGIRNFNTWGSVSVMVVKLRNLKDVGGVIGKLTGDGNDPYVQARLYGAGLGMEGVKDKTRSKKNGGSNARLNETMLFSVDNRQMTPGSVSSLMLELQVFDYDEHSNDDLIGKITIPVMPFQIFGGHMWEDWFPIKYGNKSELAGEVQLVMQWLPEGATSGMQFKLGGDKPLWIHVKKAMGLLDVTSAFSAFGGDYKMDPFVRVEVVDQDTKVDSDIAVDEGKTPTWDSYFPVDISDGEAQTKLKISVFDNNGKSNTLIGEKEITLTSDIMEPMESEKPKDSVPDPFRKELVEYRVVPEVLMLQKNGKDAGKLLLDLRREEFEGVTGRDDGQNRGLGDTTVEEDFGEDDDDDGEADGRLHVDVLNFQGFKDPDHFIQNSKFKVRLCINPAKKFRKTEESFKFTLDEETKDEKTNTWKYDTSKDKTASGTKQKNPKNFQFVLPYEANIGNTSAKLEETNVTFQLYVPKKGLFGKKKIFAMGTIPWEILDPLEPGKNEDNFPPKPPVEYDVPLNIVKDNETITLGSAKVRLTYIPFVAGKIKVGVSKAYNLPLGPFKEKKPRIQMIPVIDGKEVTSRKTDMQPSAPSNGKDAEKGNPEWTNPQMTLRYTNGKQKQPDYLKIKVTNVPNKFVGEYLVPFYDILRHNVGGKIILEGKTLTNEKGSPTNGKIDAEIIFYIDGKAAIAKTTAKEEKAIVENNEKAQQGENVPESEETKQRKEDATKIMKLKELFYKIDKDHSDTITKEELKTVIMDSAESNKEISEFLQKAWKAYTKVQNNLAKDDKDKQPAPKEYNADNVVDMIEGVGGDDTITFQEWVQFTDRNIIAQREEKENKNKSKPSGDGKLARAKQKMNALSNMMEKFDNQEQINAENIARKKRNEMKKRRAEKKKREKEEAERLAKLHEQELEKKRADDLKLQESRNKELELELKMQKYREEARLAREKADEEKERKAEAKRLAEDKKKRKLERNKIKYVDLPEKQVMHWKPYHVEKWIRTKLELPQYASRFSEASVDGLLLLSLTENDMKDEELNVDKKLHRAKIFVHIMRLREMAGLPPNDYSRSGGTVSTTAKKRGGRSVIQIGKSGGAGIAAAPELMRLKLKKFTNKVEAQVRKENAEDKEADAVWPFQYDNPANVDLVTEVNMWDFDNDWADQFQEDDPFGREIIDDEDEPPEEAQFRRAMTNVWKKDAEMAKQHGWTVAAEEAFGDDAPGAGKSAKADPYAFIMKFAKENQLSFYEAVEEPEIKKLNLKLKTGDSIYAQTEAARETRQLPPEFWFKNKTPWWMTIDDKEMEDDGEGGTRPKPRKRRTKIPNLATTEEVLAVVRQAVLEYGRNLESHRKKNMPKEQFEEDMKNRRLKIKKLRSKQGLPDMKPMAEEEDRLLADVFTAFSNLQNNETVQHGKSGSWTGFHDKLNRLKLQGAIKVLLKLDMNWQQFDAFFRTLSTNHDGTLQQDEFVAAFRSKGKLSDLLRNDKAGEASRKGGRRRRHNRNLSREEGYHGMGAKKGDEDWRQILDALYGVLRTLEESHINLREAFESFDRNASGEISVAEFASLMKTLGGYGLTKRQMYHLINMMDANFDRTIRYNEFMEFFLVVWVGRLKELRNNLRLHKKGAPDDGTLDYGHQLTENQIKRKLAKAEHAIKATFGSGFMAAAKTAGAVLPGAFSALMKKMGLETNAIKSSFMPTDKTGKQLVEEAREMTLSPDGRRYKRQFEAEVLANRTITAPRERKKKGKRVNIKETNKQIAGKHTLNQMAMTKAQKRASGELNGPRFKNYGANGDRELGMGKRSNVLDKFPSDYISKNPS